MSCCFFFFAFHAFNVYFCFFLFWEVLFVFPFGIFKLTFFSLFFFLKVLECLQNQLKLGESCRHVLFAIKKSELTDSGTDYTLLNTCKDMINQFCHNAEQTKVLECLKVKLIRIH